MTRQEELTQQLSRYAEAYYDADAPKISDAEYDALYDELAQLEDELQELLRQKMRDLYAYLEEDYDSLTSDEFLRDRFTDDDTLLFAEDGTIHYV